MSTINPDEQKRLQDFRNWNTTQQALDALPKNVKTKAPGRRDRRTLLTTLAVIAALLLGLLLLSRMGIL